MDLPEKFHSSTVLSQVANHIQAHHSNLQVARSSHHVTYKETLPATLDCVHGLDDLILLSTTNLARREALRAQTLENKRFSKEATPFSSSCRICTTGKLGATDFPKSLPLERRALLKKMAFDQNTPHTAGSLRSPTTCLAHRRYAGRYCW